ncbi:hypothetical protein F4604DRAFT_1933926 [Suillus subluteus]|nr:hypothetical protein F4604DRAFT_1933926 [Suillus subluteus]
MGFWYPHLNLRFQSNLPEHPPVADIFFFEALCVASAIHDAVTRIPVNRCLAIYTNSLNTVYMFNTLSAGLGYNRLLVDAVEIVLVFNVDFRVFHVAGEDNVVADHLSHWRAREAMDTPSNSHPDTAEIAADINNSSWAARNSNHPILTPCALLNAAQKAQVKAWKASCKLSAEQQKEAEDTLTTAIQQLLIDENEKISTLAHMT